MRGLVFVFLISSSGALRAGSFGASGRGTTTANFLQLGAGARAVSMGEAYSAVADEASALYWNPGALTRVEKRSVTFMHAAGINYSYFDYAAFVQNLGGDGAIGMSVQYLSAGGVTQTDDATGQDVGSFIPHDVAFSMGYAHDLHGYSIGVAGKFVQSTLLTSDQTGAVDAGIVSPAFLDGRLRLAMAMANLGGSLKFDQVKERLPLTFRAGGSFRITNHWLASADAVAPNNNAPYGALGAEYWLAVTGDLRLAGRAGFNSQTIGSVTGVSGVTGGLGFAFQAIAVDYAFAPFGALGNIHRMSLTLKF